MIAVHMMLNTTQLQRSPSPVRITLTVFAEHTTTSLPDACAWFLLT